MDFTRDQICLGENMKRIGITVLLAVLGYSSASVAYAQTKAGKVPAESVQPQISPNPPAILTRVSFIQSMDSEFKARDTNTDGKVSRAEVEEFERRSALRKTQIDNNALFLRLDADNNGFLTAAEFQKLIGEPILPDTGSIMQRFDKNRDQQITIIEYRTATLVNFDNLDADKDGTVDQNEMAASQYKEQNMEKNR